MIFNQLPVALSVYAFTAFSVWVNREYFYLFELTTVIKKKMQFCLVFQNISVIRYESTKRRNRLKMKEGCGRVKGSKFVLPVKKTVGDPSPSNNPDVLESKRSQRPTASTPVPASCKRRWRWESGHQNLRQFGESHHQANAFTFKRQGMDRTKSRD